jgi:hypothetical protein
MRFVAAFAIAALMAGCSHGHKKMAHPHDAKTDAKAAEAKAEAKAEKAEKKAVAKAEGADSFKCSHATDEREATVETKGEGCEVKYKKMGEEKVIASAAKGSEHCKTVAGRIRQHLEEAGFKCTP